jgi:hypothetical protein
MKDMDFIGKMYQNKLNEFPVPEATEEEWKKISSTLRWRRFFKFYPNSFNIYYLSATLIACVAFSTLTLTEPSESSVTFGTRKTGASKAEITLEVDRNRTGINEKVGLDTIKNKETYIYTIDESVKEDKVLKADEEKSENKLSKETAPVTTNTTKKEKPRSETNTVAKLKNTENTLSKPTSEKTLSTVPCQEERISPFNILSEEDPKLETETVIAPVAAKEHKKQVKEPKVVYITKRDTIFVIDSIPAKNRRNQRKP